jgi:hypothetical protein
MHKVNFPYPCKLLGEFGRSKGAGATQHLDPHSTPATAEQLSDAAGELGLVRENPAGQDHLHRLKGIANLSDARQAVGGQRLGRGGYNATGGRIPGLRGSENVHGQGGHRILGGSVCPGNKLIRFIELQCPQQTAAQGWPATRPIEFTERRPDGA